MNRTKWMRLSVRDLGDVIRWAGAQNAREISEFRYRVVNGREIVSFRLVPRYAIDIGAREIVVLAYAQIIGWRARIGNLRRIAVAAVQRAVGRLPERCRLIFTLHREQGLTYPEIAEVLEISPKTVEVLMGRALKALRKALAGFRS